MLCRSQGTVFGLQSAYTTGQPWLSPGLLAQSVSLERFEAERLLELVPPDGEFAVMNYRSTHPFKPPFRVTCTVEDDPHSAFKARPLPQG